MATTTFFNRASELVSEMVSVVYPIVNKAGKIEFELNYTNGAIEAMDNDFGTIWVKIGEKYNCKFEDLPFSVMALVADKIVNI